MALVTLDSVVNSGHLTLTGRKVVMRPIVKALLGVTLLVVALGAMQATTIFAHENGKRAWRMRLRS